ncbi:MAG TPA: nuclear transport factor 2 family protein [Gaiellaceae bacterium]|nr:nuclear transport factor 2 family protein [Gaiellaceae bacterium]
MTRIEELLDRYTAAVGAKDVGAFVALYADDVVVFDMWGVPAYRGRAAWRATVEEWFSSLGDESVGVTFRDLETRGPLAHMLVRYAGLSPAGEELRALTNRMTWVVEEGKVVHEHSSAPADPETGKVILG